MTFVVIPNRPAGTDQRDISLILANFDAITSVVNGGLDTTNLAVGAAIKGSQLASNAGILGSQLAAGAAIADTQLASPSLAVRRLVLHTTGIVNPSVAGTDGLLVGNSFLQSGVGAQLAIPIFTGDSGGEFAVAGKTTRARIRASYLVNSTAPGVNFTVGLYQITGVGGSTSQVSVAFGSAIAGTTVNILTPPAGGNAGAETAEFNLPATTALYALGAFVSPSMAAASAVMLSAQMYVYNT